MTINWADWDLTRHSIKGIKTLGEADGTLRSDGVIIVRTSTHHVLITFCLTPSNQHLPLNVLNKSAVKMYTIISN